MQELLSYDSPAMQGGPSRFYGAFFFLLMAGGLILDMVLISRSRGSGHRWRDGVQQLAQRPWTGHSGGRVLIALAALHFMLTSATLIIHRTMKMTEQQLFIYAIVLQTLVYYGIGMGFILWIMRANRMTWHQAFGIHRASCYSSVKKGLLFYAAAMPLFVIITALYWFLLDSLGHDRQPQAVLSIFMEPHTPLWLKIHVVVLAVVVAPFFEELIFRGIALNMATRYLSIGPAIALVTLVFACLHFHVPSLLPLMVIGVAFSWGYILSGSLLTSIVMHAVFNGISLATLLLMQSS